MSATSKARYAQRLVGHVRVLVLGPVTLSEAEFDTHLAEAQQMANSVRAVLVVVLGIPELSVERRAKLARANLVRTPTAVLSDSVLIRAILTALRWLGGNMRSFPINAAREAGEFLSVPPEAQQTLVDSVRTMIAEVSTGGAQRSGEWVPDVERIARDVGARADKIRRNVTK